MFVLQECTLSQAWVGVLGWFYIHVQECEQFRRLKGG